MKNGIHFDTIQRYFKIKYNADIEQRAFVNNVSGEVYYVIFPKGTDIAVFSVRDNGNYICIDSNGESVSGDKIIGYINDMNVKKDDADIIISEDVLALQYNSEEINLNQIMQREEMLYPEKTSIVLSAYLDRKMPLENLNPFYVDDVVYVNNKDFNDIIMLRSSQIFIDYNNKHFKRERGVTNGLVVINEDGNGVLVDTQGYDYARYMTYAPQIGKGIESMIEDDMREKAVYEMKLYMPLKVEERNIELDETHDVDGGIYLNKINDTIHRDSIYDTKRGLADKLDKNSMCRKKIYSIKPGVEMVNDLMMGVVAIKMTKPLTAEEIEDLKDFIFNEMADEWGGRFGRQAIQINGNDIYVHFWNSTEYFINTEEEIICEPKISMDGIQGM